MKKLRVYIDTSVIGGCFDEEFRAWSKKFFEEVMGKRIIAVVSDLTVRELQSAPKHVRDFYNALPQDVVENVALSPEAEALAKSYLKEKVVTHNHLVDAQHIAVASVEKVDVLISWNFQQIVNLNKIHLFNAVNLKNGYSELEIRSPREVADEG